MGVMEPTVGGIAAGAETSEPHTTPTGTLVADMAQGQQTAISKEAEVAEAVAFTTNPTAAGMVDLNKATLTRVGPAGPQTTEGAEAAELGGAIRVCLSARLLPVFQSRITESV